MRFWSWHHRETHDPQPTEEAREAVQQAQRALMDAERRDEAAQDIAARLEQTRDRNHFTAAVIRRMRGA